MAHNNGSGVVLRQHPPKQLGQARVTRNIDGTVLDVRHASAFCGWSEKKTRAMVSRGLVPYRRLSGRIIFFRSELTEFLNGLPGVTPTEAMENQAMRTKG